MGRVYVLSHAWTPCCPKCAAFHDNAKHLTRHRNNKGKDVMKVAVRAAIGLVLLAMAAPAGSIANANPLDEESPYASLNTRSVKKTRKPNRSVSARNETGLFQSSGLGTPQWISVARQYMGTNPTGKKSLWCADFMNLVLKRSGLPGTGSRAARSFANYGQRLSGPKVGAIAVVSRGKGGGHVGIVTSVDANGNPILLSGNHGNKVAEGTYSKSRVIAYVWPAS